MNNFATLSNDAKYTAFKFNNQTIRFATSSKLERYTKIVNWDNGYLVVMAKYKNIPEQEEYIDITHILNNLYFNAQEFLSNIQEVRIENDR